MDSEIFQKRFSSILKPRGILTLGKLLKMTYLDFRKAHGLGQKAKRELIDYARNNQFSFNTIRELILPSNGDLEGITSLLNAYGESYDSRSSTRSSASKFVKFPKTALKKKKGTVLNAAFQKSISSRIITDSSTVRVRDGQGISEVSNFVNSKEIEQFKSKIGHFFSVRLNESKSVYAFSRAPVGSYPISVLFLEDSYVFTTSKK